MVLGMIVLVLASGDFNPYLSSGSGTEFINPLIQQADSTWFSLSGEPPFEPVEQLFYSLDPCQQVTIVLHNIVKPSIDPSFIITAWSYDSLIVTIDTMWFDVYDSHGNPFEWWMLWEPFSVATWRYQGEVLPKFMFYMFNPIGPMYNLPADSAPWHIGVVKMTNKEYSHFTIDTTTFPPQNHTMFAPFGGGNMVIPDVVPVYIELWTNLIVDDEYYDTLDYWGDTSSFNLIISDEWSSGFWANIFGPDSNISLALYFNCVNDTVPVTVVIDDTVPPPGAVNSVHKYWYIDVDSNAFRKGEAWFYYNDSDFDPDTLPEENWSAYKFVNNQWVEMTSIHSVGTNAVIAYNIHDFSLWTVGRDVMVSSAEKEKMLIKDVFLRVKSPIISGSGAVIEFKIPEESMVSLEIIDNSGRLLRRLVHRRLKAGKHSYTWDMRDKNGKMLNPGVYFVALSTDLGQITKKVIVIK